jgi:hypothetical protein
MRPARLPQFPVLVDSPWGMTYDQERHQGVTDGFLLPVRFGSTGSRDARDGAQGASCAPARGEGRGSAPTPTVNLAGARRHAQRGDSAGLVPWAFLLSGCGYLREKQPCTEPSLLLPGR